MTHNLKQKIKEHIYDIIPTTDSMKRGLINSLGSIIEIITGNPDQEDAKVLRKKLIMEYLSIQTEKLPSLLQITKIVDIN